MSSETQSTQSAGSQETYNGRCKWFNNRLGYGFITVDNSSEHNNVQVICLFIKQTFILIQAHTEH